MTAGGLRPIPISIGMFRETAVALVMLGRISWNAWPLHLVDKWLASTNCSAQAVKLQPVFGLNQIGKLTTLAIFKGFAGAAFCSAASALRKCSQSKLGPGSVLRSGEICW